ncbi:1-phosphatidylinositol phosphodiesterase [Cytospora mali]|uniref:1-phosphatidylinositol phosphodiesterase n=1 Tax=Cytospora mali TaxID=578113 RepID=A0A194VY26_CYTMA|nr:1-phosphatidylinositol phosphodiesterase [Valsa mali]
MYGSHSGRGRTNIIVLIILVVLCSYFLLHIVMSVLKPVLPSFTSNPPASYHNYTSSFSFDLDQPLRTDWMSWIPDWTNITSLSIPGTHDTETYDLVDNPVYQCQNHDLKAQLRAGLRYFDIRGRLLINETAGGEDADPVIGIFHGRVYTGYTFKDVLLTMFEFLEEYPTEGIVMRLKQEGSPVRVSKAGIFDDDPDITSHTTFEGAFNHYRLGNAITEPGSTRHLLLPWPPSSTDALPAWPTMGQLRSRIIVLQEFPSVSGPYGVPWKSPHINLEDLWIIPSLDHLELKWDAIRNKLVEAAASPDGSDVLFLSHLSASVGVLPIEAAAGPLVEVNGTIIVGMNDRTGLWLEGGERQGGGKTGIIMADFPGQRLVDTIVRRNAWLMDDHDAVRLGMSEGKVGY